MKPHERLEREWAIWNNLDPAGMVACSSGTAALCLSLEALQLPLGSRVVTCDYNMIAIPRAIVLAGHKPVFVDCDERLLIDSRSAEEVIAQNDHPARAVVVTHLYGRKVHIVRYKNQWERIARVHQCRVVEDLAEAHGVRPDQGTDAACWSHYRNKLVHGEEGGTVWFRDPRHAELARELRCLGFTSNHDYRHTQRGHNYRLADSLAELILVNLGMVQAELNDRRNLEEELHHLTPETWRMPARQSPWVYDLRIPGCDRSRLADCVQLLNHYGVQARLGFYPMTGQAEFHDPFASSNNPNAYRAANEVFYLPLVREGYGGVSLKRVLEIVKAKLG